MPESTQTIDSLSGFHECTRTWFAEAFAAPTKAQDLSWPPIQSGQSTLLLAPTGSGKTLAAFLAALDRVMFGGLGERNIDSALEAPSPSPSPADEGGGGLRGAARERSVEAARDASGKAAGSKSARAGVRVLYISPLKALGVDIDRNLKAPIAGIRAVAQRSETSYTEPSVAVRSGDTPQRERQAILRIPPDVLITTPESLYLMLTSNAESILASVETVIIDEIHVMVPTKRGVHLFLSLERLERLRKKANENCRPLQRIGLSATQRPLEEVAKLLGGGVATADPDLAVTPRPVQIVDASEPKRLELTVEVPVEDMARLGDNAFRDGSNSESGNAALGEPSDASMFTSPTPPSIWPAIHPRLLELINKHRSTMIFVNSRRLAERLSLAINELAAEENPDVGEVALAHHGSVAKEKRAAIEDRLKRGQLPAIIATSSLELGIDMGAVDLVIQIEAPPSIASGMQRIGRAGHQVGESSRGVIFPKYRGDLLACSAATGRMLEGTVEETYYPRNPLDLIGQQIVAIVARESISVDDLYALLRGAAPYADLPRGSFEGILDMLAGRYPSDEFSELRPRINWDRLTGVLSSRRGTQRLAILNGGTIPDRGLYGVFLAGDGPDGTGGSRVGELDEEMVFETQPGDVFLLGASTWRVLEITRDRVIVVPAPGEPGRMPFWRGDAPGRPMEFGRAIGQLARELTFQDEQDALERLDQQHALDGRAAKNLLRYLHDQQEATGETPSDRAIVVESFLDEIGDWRVCILSPFGARVHTPWAIAVAAQLRESGVGEVDMSWSDDGLMFRLLESENPPAVDQFLPQASDVEELITRQLGSTALFAARFRENAARALLLPKRRPQGRTPLWMQRRKSADLLQVAARYPSFPILMETYRECLRDVFDLPGLISLLRDVEQRRVRIVTADTTVPSPFAASLMFNYTANFLYEGDAPLAERRAAALALDHTQLRELLGDTDLSELLDEEVIDQIGLEVGRLDRPMVRDADDLHELLLMLGDLSRDEIAVRCDKEIMTGEMLEASLDKLLSERRIMAVRIGGDDRFAAAEDAARLRDALGVNPTPGLPAAFLQSVTDPLGDMISRYARTHAPFTAGDVAQRLGLGEAPVLSGLRQLAESGRIVEGVFVTGLSGRQWCDASVLRKIKRRSLAKLRQQVEATPAVALARFLPAWHGVTQPARGMDGLLDVVEQLQGAPLLASALESEILPARIVDYQSSDLDELFLAGEVTWRGIEGVGASDGRVALYLTDQEPLLSPWLQKDDSQSDEPDPLEDAIRELLSQRGALRFEEIVDATDAFSKDVLDALWRLVWQGELTNDTLAPLRSMLKQTHAIGTPRSKRTRRGQSRKPRFRSRRRSVLAGSEGRWSLAARNEQPSTTERQAAVVMQLLQRHGVFTRGAASREWAPGGFAALYPVLKAMEEAGKVRRGYFVEGLGGAQFAVTGADELLRAESDPVDPQASNAVILAATDPANAYGAALPWPKPEDSAPNNEETEKSRLQRTAGALVILCEGNLVGYIGRSGKNLTTFISSEEPDRSRQIKQLATALARRATDRGSVLLEKIDGERPANSPLAEALLESGFFAINRGFVHRGES